LFKKPAEPALKKPKPKKAAMSSLDLLSERRRSSKREAAIRNKHEVIERLKEHEKKRINYVAPVVKPERKLTQAERLEEAKLTEEKNIASLNQFTEMEEARKARQRAAMLARRVPMKSFIRYVSSTKLVPPRRIFIRQETLIKKSHVKEEGVEDQIKEGNIQRRDEQLGSAHSRHGSHDPTGVETPNNELINGDEGPMDIDQDEISDGNHKVDVDEPVGENEHEGEDDVLDQQEEHDENEEHEEREEHEEHDEDDDHDDHDDHDVVKNQLDKQRKVSEQGLVENEEETRVESPENERMAELGDLKNEGDQTIKNEAEKAEPQDQEEAIIGGKGSDNATIENNYDVIKIKEEDTDMKDENEPVEHDDDMKVEGRKSHHLSPVAGPWVCRAKTTVSLLEFPEEYEQTKLQVKSILLGKQSLRPGRVQKPKKTCVVTGEFAKFIDPQTKVPFANLQAYKILQLIKDGTMAWDAGLGGLYSGRKHRQRHARGVPEGFGEA
jgi:vacuolar protein sorting-associated protein 72